VSLRRRLDFSFYQYVGARTRHFSNPIDFQSPLTRRNNPRKPGGSAARFSHAVRIGSTVELQGLPTNTDVTARIVNCISVSKRENLWLLALELDEPGNVWGIEAVPADWFSSP